jgi:hypothetical protein
VGEKLNELCLRNAGASVIKIPPVFDPVRCAHIASLERKRHTFATGMLRGSPARQVSSRPWEVVKTS